MVHSQAEGSAPLSSASQTLWEVGETGQELPGGWSKSVSFLHHTGKCWGSPHPAVSPRKVF